MACFTTSSQQFPSLRSQSQRDAMLVASRYTTTDSLDTAVKTMMDAEPCTGLSHLDEDMFPSSSGQFPPPSGPMSLGMYLHALCVVYEAGHLFLSSGLLCHLLPSLSLHLLFPRQVMRVWSLRCRAQNVSSLPQHAIHAVSSQSHTLYVRARARPQELLAPDCSCSINRNPTPTPTPTDQGWNQEVKKGETNEKRMNHVGMA